LSKKPFQKELAMHRLTFDPGQRRVLLLVKYKVTFNWYHLTSDFVKASLYHG
jgi:hypothetical protein